MNRIVAGAIALLAAMAASTGVAAILVRSTVPSAISGTVTHEQIRQRATVNSQVYRIKVDGSAWREVDRHLAEQVDVGDRVQKSAWSPVLHVEGRSVVLVSSGSVLLILLHLALLALVLMVALRPDLAHATAKRICALWDRVWG